MSETRAQRTKRAAAILRRLKNMYPDARCELIFSTPLELAVAAILSAQCTDKRVNTITPGLFRKYRKAADWAAVPQDTLEREIHSTGFFRNKAKSIRNLGKAVHEQYGGTLPDDIDALCKLPGIGRKTANLIMVSAFGRPGIIVDTHAGRVSRRLGLTAENNPDRVERELKEYLPEKEWGNWSHVLVFHGRYCCTSRKPGCDACALTGHCPFYASSQIALVS